MTGGIDILSDHAIDVIDVLDRVLDKGVRIDSSMRVSCVGIELVGVEAHMTVVSVETYLACQLAWAERVELAVGFRPYASGVKSASR